MAWTTPRTWVTGETVTAALMNAHVRDNLLETSAATVTTAGDMTYADGNKSMGGRLAIGGGRSMLISDGSAPLWSTWANDSSAGSDTLSTASLGTGYIPLNALDSGTLPDIAVTLTVDGTSVLILWGLEIQSSTTGKVVRCGIDISGATTQAPASNISLAFEAATANDLISFGRSQIIGGLTSGSNTFQLEVKSEATNVATIRYPYLWVLSF